MYGLTKTELDTLNNLIRKYHSDLEWVKLFGSRAKGAFKKQSDIDLAIKQNHDILLELKGDCEESDLPYTVDIVDYDKVSNKNLKSEIDKHGKFLYLSDVLSDDSADTVLQYKLKDFQDAFDRLKYAVSLDPHEDSLYLDAIIQRFEFTFELSWKLMKAYLSYQGIESNSPRSSFRAAFKIELIDEVTDWLKMIEDRNRTSHTYDEAVAWEVHQLIKSVYLGLFEQFLGNISTKVN